MIRNYAICMQRDIAGVLLNTVRRASPFTQQVQFIHLSHLPGPFALIEGKDGYCGSTPVSIQYYCVISPSHPDFLLFPHHRLSQSSLTMTTQHICAQLQKRSVLLSSYFALIHNSLVYHLMIMIAWNNERSKREERKLLSLQTIQSWRVELIQILLLFPTMVLSQPL